MNPMIDEATSLFREPPESFIASRDALAGRLREEGRADDAAAVKALRKPTLLAWALNQLAARDPDGVTALADAGAELRAAQRAAVSSERSAGRLKEATETRRAAVARLAVSARGVLSEAGRPSDAHADALGAALEAASVDDGAAAALRSGTFDRPPERPAGFGDVLGLSLVATGRGEEATTPATPPTGARGGTGRRSSVTAGAGAATDERAILKAEVSKLRRDRDAAARKAGTARGRADGFARELAGAKERLEKIAAKHADAETRAKTEERAVARAERALAKAQERLERSS
jgi:hypothetical protein